MSLTVLCSQDELMESRPSTTMMVESIGISCKGSARSPFARRGAGIERTGFEAIRYLEVPIVAMSVSISWD
jgi:hypothetical protein